MKITKKNARWLNVLEELEECCYIADGSERMADKDVACIDDGAALKVLRKYCVLKPVKK